MNLVNLSVCRRESKTTVFGAALRSVERGEATIEALFFRVTFVLLSFGTCFLADFAGWVRVRFVTPQRESVG